MPTKKKPAHSYHHGDLRRALLDAARHELHKVGMQQLSLRGVARRAGVTHAAAYHHFADKDALLRRLAQEGFEKLLASMVREVNAAEQSPLGRLRSSGIGYLKFAQEDPQALMLMFDGTKVDHDEELQAAAEAAFICLVECVAAARASQGLEGDPLPDAILHWSCVHGFSTLARGKRLEHAGVKDALESGTRQLDRLMLIYRIK
jgi:AcrR family transcriptional regulator